MCIYKFKGKGDDFCVLFLGLISGHNSLVTKKVIFCYSFKVFECLFRNNG